MKYSIVILTKDRKFPLLECLSSILTQHSKVDELILVDNNSSDGTKEVIRNFKKAVKFPVRYYCVKKRGYPFLRNFGMKKAVGEWVVFLDDDCVATDDWLKSIRKTVQMNPTSAAILGNSLTYYTNSFFSQLYFVKDQIWKRKGTHHSEVIDPEILDCKNLALHKLYLKKNKIQFDENRQQYNGYSEDCDLGMQIFRSRGKVRYSKHMKVFHKDPTAFLTYYRKLIYATKGHYSYERKWEKIRKKMSVRKSEFKTENFLKEFFQEHHFSLPNKIVFGLHLLFSYIVVKIVKHCLKLKYYYYLN